MTVITTLENLGHAMMTAAEHAAAWLVGTVAQGETALNALEADSPLVATAIAAGEASALAHGIPVPAIAVAGEEVLALAKDLAAGLAQPAPAAAAATAPAA